MWEVKPDRCGMSKNCRTSKQRRVDYINSLLSVAVSVRDSPLTNRQHFARGPPTFVIQRTFHHYIEYLLPQQTAQAGGGRRRQSKYAEIYFYNGEEDQLACRLKNFEQLDTPLPRGAMEMIQAIFHQANPFTLIARGRSAIGILACVPDRVPDHPGLRVPTAFPADFRTHSRR